MGSEMPRQLHSRFPRHRFLPLIVTALLAPLLSLWAAPARADVELSSCGQFVPPGATAYLKTDLDCRGVPGEGVVLGDRARLELSGYRILGGRVGDGGSWQGVRCRTGSVCTILGPGEIRGFSASGVAGTRVRIREVIIRDNAKAGVIAYENIVLRDALVEGNGSVGVHAGGHARIRHSLVAAEPQGRVVEDHMPPHRPDTLR